MRKLAAIMFTDISGYTAMMEANEESAVASAKRHEQTMNRLVPENDGKLIHFYGDGSLSIFPTASQALTCAREVQVDLQAGMKVPLRIGVHIGEITEESGKIYGDGVNVAARIESSGHAGTILFSRSVQDKIKNNPSFKYASVGFFKFKNVGSSQELFVLLDDRLEKPDRKKLQNRSTPVLITKRMGQAAIILTFLMLMLGWLIFRKSGTPEPEMKSLAVLPFKNLSSEAEDAKWFSDGVMEDVLTHLSKLHGLRVISRTSVMHYENTGKSISEIARELDVDYVLEGSARKSGTQARITAQLLNARDESIWADNFDRQFQLEEIFTIQMDVAKKIVHELSIAVSSQEQLLWAKVPTRNIKAYELLLRGRHAADARSMEGLQKSAEFYQNAISLDPEYGEAYAELANSIYLMGTYQMILTDSALLQARRLVNHALSIDSSIARSYTVLGNLYRNESFAELSDMWDESKKAYEKAIRLNPNDATAYLHYSRYYTMKFPPDYMKQLQLVNKALSLDPLSYIMNKAYIEVLLLNRKFAEALDHFSKVEFLVPSAEYNLILREIYTAKKEWEEVIEIMKKDVEENPSQESYADLARGYRNFYKDFPHFLEYMLKAIEISSTPSARTCEDYFASLCLTGQYENAVLFIQGESSCILSDMERVLFSARLAKSRGNLNGAADLYEQLEDVPLDEVGYCYGRMGDSASANIVLQKIHERTLQEKMRYGKYLSKVMVYAGLAKVDSLIYYIDRVESNAWRNMYWVNSRIFDIHYRQEMDQYRDEDWFIDFLKRHRFPIESQ